MSVDHLQNRGAKRRAEFYQGSSWKIGTIRDEGSTKEWVTQTSLDYAAPPPIDVNTLLKTRFEGAARLRDLRQHKFVLGSRGAAVEEECTPVSRDIGNYRPEHISYVKKAALSTNFKGAGGEDSSQATHISTPPAWFKSQASRPVTAPVLTGGHAHGTTLPPVHGTADHRGELYLADTTVNPNLRAQALPAHDGIEFRKALIQSHWKIGGDKTNSDYRTSNQIAYEERAAPHPDNRKGFKGSWHQVKHSLYRPTTDSGSPIVAAGGGGSSSTGLAGNTAATTGASHAGRGVDTNVLTWSTQARFYRVEQDPSQWKTIQHADYTRPEAKTGEELKEQKMTNFQKTQEHKYSSNVAFSYRDPCETSSANVSETHHRFQRPAREAYSVRADPAAATAASLAHRFASSNVFRPSTANAPTQDSWRTTYMKDMNIQGFSSRLF